MPGFKRTRSTSGSSSSSYNTRSHKVAKSIGKRISPGTKIYIVQAKISSPDIAKLFRLAESLTTKLCKNAEDADVIITAIGMQKRLERHIPAQQIVELLRDLRNPIYLTIWSEREGHCDSRMVRRFGQEWKIHAIFQICCLEYKQHRYRYPVYGTQRKCGSHSFRLAFCGF